MKKNSFLLFIFLLLVVACQKGKTMRTESGMKYILYTDGKGLKPLMGDYVTYEMVYKNENDSVLFDTRMNGVPFRMQLNNIPFKGSMEEGLTYLGEGDSATLFVSADSLNEKVFKTASGEPDSRSVLRSGSLVKFEIKLVDVQTKAEAEKEIAVNAEKRKVSEPVKIKEYIEKNHITAKPDSNGIYIICDKLSNGKISDGDLVIVNYESRYLNGILFDTNKSTGKPFAFTMGKHEVIQCWEIAFKKFEKGTKATLISPSAFAYGEKGLMNPRTGAFIVPPYSGLVFTIEVLDVMPASAAK
jgi:FKBP-type peptidyl-prolyl cis-trans isomerase